MAMVIDDRLQVWDDKDQPRVHVVPAFTPYYAPQAEMANAVPVLCVARNVACNVRGGFFKEFDENLMRRIFDLCYENEMLALPYSPDVSDYLITEDTGVVPNNNKEVPVPEGIGGSEVEERLNQPLHSRYPQGSDFSLLQTGPGDERNLQDQLHTTVPSLDDDPPLNGSSLNNNGSSSLLPSSLFISVLQEIGRRCDSKVEFRPIIGGNKDLNFSVEVLFSTERIGIGKGRTRKEAQFQAAEDALRTLESNYISFIAPTKREVDGEINKLSLQSNNGFLEDIIDPTSDESSRKEDLSSSNTSDQLGQLYTERLPSLLSGIREMCTENQDLVFLDQAPASMILDKGEYYSQVELEGRVLGKGIGLSMEAAKFQAAEEALTTLKAAVGSQEQKHQCKVNTRFPD
ncbi:RNA polymerase II C-terminal domain phosphatase-like 2 isoform X1 [Iris pallida]|uniref:RNA polymerase II C-terminal domain phosphatase-like 2 isoform X1 n=1 Tax=Iris pallida TaxID=29817 RepID=A0AAX6G157_IRIPA|nr:RNA polymerase II C-terminal domain phosphatase-like 2 isoform X1 [Iris pallida]